MAEQTTKDKIKTIMNQTGAQISVNVSENYIFTTEDKIRILYNEYNSARKHSGNFLAFLGIFLSILITLVTCDFKDLPFMNAATVKAIFVMAMLLSLGYCVHVGIQWKRNKDKLTFDYFFKKLQGEYPNE